MTGEDIFCVVCANELNGRCSIGKHNNIQHKCEHDQGEEQVAVRILLALYLTMLFFRKLRAQDCHWSLRLQSGFNACHAQLPNRHRVPHTISTTPSLPAQPRTLLNPATGLTRNAGYHDRGGSPQTRLRSSSQVLDVL
jgi:hypothetical protein